MRNNLTSKIPLWWNNLYPKHYFYTLYIENKILKLKYKERRPCIWRKKTEYYDTTVFPCHNCGREVWRFSRTAGNAFPSLGITYEIDSYYTSTVVKVISVVGQGDLWILSTHDITLSQQQFRNIALWATIYSFCLWSKYTVGFFYIV